MSGLSQQQLQDSQATLRLVDDLVADLAAEADEAPLDTSVMRMLDSLAERRGDVDGVEGLLVRMYAELQRILYSVRRSRGLLEEAAIGHLESTTAKLQEVSSATEFAASNMLDGVDRALALVDKVEEDPEKEDFDSLRDELHSLVVALQFQDITSQQLEHASSIIHSLENQLRRVTRMFAMTVLREVEDGDDGSDHGGDTARPDIEPGSGSSADSASTFDPAASTNDAATRQALADDIFKVG